MMVPLLSFGFIALAVGLIDSAPHIRINRPGETDVLEAVPVDDYALGVYAQPVYIKSAGPRGYGGGSGGQRGYGGGGFPEGLIDGGDSAFDAIGGLGGRGGHILDRDYMGSDSGIIEGSFVARRPVEDDVGFLPVRGRGRHILGRRGGDILGRRGGDILDRGILDRGILDELPNDVDSIEGLFQGVPIEKDVYYPAGGRGGHILGGGGDLLGRRGDILGGGGDILDQGILGIESVEELLGGGVVAVPIEAGDAGFLPADTPTLNGVEDDCDCEDEGTGNILDDANIALDGYMQENGENGVPAGFLPVEEPTLNGVEDDCDCDEEEGTGNILDEANRVLDGYMKEDRRNDERILRNQQTENGPGRVRYGNRNGNQQTENGPGRVRYGNRNGNQQTEKGPGRVRYVNRNEIYDSGYGSSSYGSGSYEYIIDSYGSGASSSSYEIYP